MFKRILSATVSVILAATLLAGADQGEGKKKGGKKAAAGDAAKGKELFEQCGVCHNADSTEKKMGPGLKGLFSRADGKLGNKKDVNDANVLEVINNGGNGMPAYDSILSGEEKAHVLAYLKTL